MRVRFAALASMLTAVMAVALPSAVMAAPHHNRGLTINATPNPILAGEGVLIYGQLNTAPVGGQTIVLYHHIAGSHQGYTRIGETTTNTYGFYEFTRAENVVLTNRSWFAREAGGSGVHSRTVYERVAALVGLSASTANGDTNHAILFSGHVTPNHAGQRVFLQEQIGSSDAWTTLKSGLLGPGSNYTIAYRWRTPGERDVRVLLPTDNRNIAGQSDPVSVTIQQTQVAGFTISSSAPVVGEGGSVTISGVLDKPGTTSPESSTVVQLWGRTAYQSRYVVLADATTGSDGSYTFSQAPQYNTLYQVRTAFAPHRHSAVLFEGVRDVVTMSPSTTSSTVGGTVTFTGTVLPDKAGHVIYLQRLGTDGYFHTVEVRFVRPNSTFQFAWRFGTAGTKAFRARITSDRGNVGGSSAPVTISVGLPAVSSLPAAS